MIKRPGTQTLEHRRNSTERRYPALRLEIAEQMGRGRTFLEVIFGVAEAVVARQKQGSNRQITGHKQRF
jgi:hypothetical protein